MEGINGNKALASKALASKALTSKALTSKDLIIRIYVPKTI